MVFIIWLSILGFLVYMMYRNNEVYKALMEKVEIVSDLCRQDISNDKPWQWRYEDYETISQDEMVCHFGKPIESFFDGHKCFIP
ncbi:MAG: hypothetical protein PHX80_03655 [Candidatus Nanoarchaeia archaeon]|nr:hypothetical protein [Candidatus Nanoarchaeia archaeon]